jgi:hypothetical protein
MTPPPRDPMGPDALMDENRHTGSYIVREYTPVQSMPDEAIAQSTARSQKTSPSLGFIISLSIVLGAILAGAALISGIGNAFYVTRSEFTVGNMAYTQDKQHLQDENFTVKQSLSRLEDTLLRQDAALQKIGDAVQAIKVDMARRGR